MIRLNHKSLHALMLVAFSLCAVNAHANEELVTQDVNAPVIAENPQRVMSNFSWSGITVNGDLSDWAGLNLFANDPVDIPFGSKDRIDLTRAGLSHDANNAYIIYENRNTIDPSFTSNTELVWGWQTYLDTDNNSGSGFKLNDSVGADYLAEGKALYKYTGNGTNWSWAKVGDTNPYYQNNIVELSFPRWLLGSHSTVKVAFVGNNRAYFGTSADFYPNDGGLSYYFGEEFYGAEAVIPSNFSGETSPANNIPPVSTTATVSVTTSSSSSTSSTTTKTGGSTSWFLFTLPALLLLRRRYR